MVCFRFRNGLANDQYTSCTFELTACQFLMSRDTFELLFLNYFLFLRAQVYAHCEADGTSCKFTKKKCDSYVKLFINDKEMVKSVKRKNLDSHNPQVTFTSERIAKNSIIRIETWDASTGFWEQNSLIQKTEGNIEDFLNEPLRNGIKCADNKHNSLETMAFWRDELKRI